jgi:hypothetical protein
MAEFAGAMGFVMFATQISKDLVKRFDLSWLVPFLPLAFALVWNFFLSEGNGEVETTAKVTESIKLWVEAAGVYGLSAHTAGRAAGKISELKVGKKK